jgi:hypothetical protein
MTDDRRRGCGSRRSSRPPGARWFGTLLVSCGVPDPGGSHRNGLRIARRRLHGASRKRQGSRSISESQKSNRPQACRGTGSPDVLANPYSLGT